METGVLSLKSGHTFHTLVFPERGWLAADLVQYLDDVLEAPEREAAILKLLGFTLQIDTSPPRRDADHWVVVDLDKRVIQTNSVHIRSAVGGAGSPSGHSLPQTSLQRLHDTLDRYDFRVELFS